MVKRIVRRWVLWFGGMWLLIVVVLAVTFWAKSISDDAFSKVKPEMTLSQVEAVVARDYLPLGWTLEFAHCTKAFRSKPRLFASGRILIVSLSDGSNPLLTDVDTVSDFL